MIPPERRRGELTFSHYKLLTKFDEEEQDEYVEAAIKNRLSVRDFDAYINKKENVFENNTNKLGPRGHNSISQPTPEVAQKTENNQLTMDKARRLSEELFATLNEIDYDALEADGRLDFIKELRLTS